MTDASQHVAGSGANAEKSSDWRELLKSAPWYELAIGSALLLAFCFALFFLAITLNAPVLDDHSFRQSQTAINIYYALHEGSLIAYQTPVLGTPWSVPFEAPVYQTIVAAVVAVTGFSIDAAGRLVSFLFLLGTIYVGGLIIRMILPRDRFVLLLFATLMLASPVYLFWGRAVLIETCAIFLGTAWLYLALRAIREGSVALSLLAAPLCILAAFAKPTTWPVFIVAFGLFWLHEARRATAPPSLAISGTIAGGIAAALFSTLWWIGISDEVKATGAITQQLTSDALSGWNYGPLKDRFSARFWSNILPERMLPDVLGFAWIIVPIALTHLKLQDRYFGAAVAGIVLFFVPLALFTNLHLVHNYYQASNGLFLIAATAIVLAGLLRKGHVRVAMAACAAILLGQIIHFSDGFWTLAVRDKRGDAFYQAARFIKETSASDKALVAFGVDWNPVLHYYGERKGLAFPSWAASAEKLQMILTDPKAMGGLQIGSVVACAPLGLDNRPDVKAVAQDFIAKSEQRAVRAERFGDCAAFVLR